MNNCIPVADSSYKILSIGLHFLQFFIILVLVAWIWVIDTAHPPHDLLRQIGNLEGRVLLLQKDSERINALKKELDDFSSAYVRKDELKD